MSSSDTEDRRTSKELVEVALQGDEEDELAWAAIRELQRRGTQEVLWAAQQLLSSMSPKERGRGADILGQLGVTKWTFPRECVDSLLERLAVEHEPTVLNSIAVALGHLGDERAVQPLVALMNHPDPDVRYGVVFGLMGHPHSEAVAALIKLSDDPDEEVRNWATFGLGSQLEEVDTPEIRDALVRRLDDAVAEVRGEALVGLSRRRDARVVGPLRRELESKNVIILAVEAAEALGDRSMLPLLEKLRDSPGEADSHFMNVLTDAIAALARLG